MFGSVLSSVVLALGMLAPMAAAHMEMTSPPPLGSQHNKNTPTESVDYNMKSPLGVDGGSYPCRGHLSLLNSPAGASVATWAPGSSQSISITGTAFHGGGSCQAMLSYDGGNSWTVIKSWIGNCPTPAGGTFSFNVPADAPPSEKAVFAWSWFNNQGNREMYQNCAAITISGGGNAKRQAGAAFSSRPAPFVANVAQASGCSTEANKDVMFPNPGPDVENSSSNTAPPVGDCGGSGGGAPAPAPPAESSAAPPAESSAAPEPAPSASTQSVPNGANQGGQQTAVPPAPSAENTTAAPSNTAAPTSDAPAPPAPTSTGPRKCKRYRKRTAHGKHAALRRRSHPARAHF